MASASATLDTPFFKLPVPLIHLMQWQISISICIFILWYPWASNTHFPRNENVLLWCMIEAVLLTSYVQQWMQGQLSPTYNCTQFILKFLSPFKVIYWLMSVLCIKNCVAKVYWFRNIKFQHLWNSLYSCIHWQIFKIFKLLKDTINLDVLFNSNKYYVKPQWPWDCLTGICLKFLKEDGHKKPVDINFTSTLIIIIFLFFIFYLI